MNIEQIKSQPDHMCEENLRFCDTGKIRTFSCPIKIPKQAQGFLGFANDCPSFSSFTGEGKISKCDYESKNKCLIAINRYASYQHKKIK